MSVVNKAIKYRLYPTAEQADLFAKTFGCCRKVWNLMLSDKQEHYAKTGTMLQTTPAMYKEQYPFLKEVDSLALANVQQNLQKAYSSFFAKKSAFPKYKSAKRSKRAYTTNNQNGTIAVEAGFVKLPKLGKVKAKVHRTAPDTWKLKSATVSQSGDGKYYVSVLYEYEAEITPLPITEDTTLGLDFKVHELYADSEGQFAGMPKYYKDSCKRLASMQRKLKHKKVGSSNYRKAQKKIAKLHTHTANQRNDFLHKSSAAIIKQWDTVCIEDLSVQQMVEERKYKHYRKSVLDNGWYAFTQMLDYKLAEKGGRLVKVDKTYPSSQICSCCGRVEPTLSDDSIRKWECSECGAYHDRDINAARNIKAEGLRILLSA